MLIQAVGSQRTALVAGNHIDRIFNLDAFKDLMTTVSSQRINGADEPLGSIDQMRQSVLNRSATRRSITIVDLAVSWAVGREMLARTAGGVNGFAKSA